MNNCASYVGENTRIFHAVWWESHRKRQLSKTKEERHIHQVRNTRRETILWLFLLVFYRSHRILEEDEISLGMFAKIIERVMKIEIKNWINTVVSRMNRIKHSLRVASLDSIVENVRLPSEHHLCEISHYSWCNHSLSAVIPFVEYSPLHFGDNGQGPHLVSVSVALSASVLVQDALCSVNDCLNAETDTLPSSKHIKTAKFIYAQLAWLRGVVLPGIDLVPEWEWLTEAFVWVSAAVSNL